MTKQDILNNALPYGVLKCYMYYLILNDEIVYVGTTDNLIGRLKAHNVSGKVFDSYSFIEIDASERYAHESVEIVKYAPRYNNSFPCTNTVKRLNLRSYSNENESNGNWCFLKGNIYYIANYNGKQIDFCNKGMNNSDFYRGNIKRGKDKRYSVCLSYLLDGVRTINQLEISPAPSNIDDAIDLYIDNCIELINKVNFNL